MKTYEIPRDLDREAAMEALEKWREILGVSLGVTGVIIEGNPRPAGSWVEQALRISED